jgi:glycosyltransferase involved in cell wall biosynthesis
MNPVISVIIPSYNRENEIPQAIESVLAQTYKNFEIIVVDDGSTDGTEKRLQEYINKKQIHYFRKDNSGPSSARNYGLNLAKGQYIAFLDSDDLWLPIKLEVQMRRFADQIDLGLVYSNVLSYNPDQGHVFLRYNKKLPSGFILDELIYKKVNLVPSSILVKKSTLDEVGAFDEVLKIHEDRDLHIRIAKICRMEAIQEPLAIFRLHGKILPKDPHSQYDFQVTKDCETRILDKLFAGNRFSRYERNKILTRYHYFWGRGFLKYEQYGEAQREFTQSIFCFPFNLKSIVFLLLSCIKRVARF